MKKYVIITPSIKDMGGAQMYVRNKVVHMREYGWDVDVISAQKGRVYIPDLREFDLFIPELGFDCYLFSKRKQAQIIKTILEHIHCERYDEIIIESTCISESTWAEAVAEKCGARHLSYLLQESNTINSKIHHDFFKFKLERHELASITKQSVFDMFKSIHSVSIDESIACYLPAYCNNVVENVDSEWIDKIQSGKHDFVVGCLSRLDKPFIVPALTDFIGYVSTHQDKRFTLVMMGGAPEKSGFERNIKKMFRNIQNVDLLITGYLFPVSTRLLGLFDVFFTSAGSSWVCMRSGVPTISIDGNDFKPIGVLGRTTNHSLFRDEKELPPSFNSLMDDILFNNCFPKEHSHHELSKPDFTSHDEFMKKMFKEIIYFSFGNLTLSRADKMLSLCLFVFGADNYYKMGSAKRKLLNKSNSDR